MKRLGLISAIVISLILLGFFIGCDNTSDYYINALIDSTAYEWRLGFTLIEDVAFGCVVTMSPVTTFLVATPDVETGVTQPNNYVWIGFEGITTGTYSISDMGPALYHIDGVEWVFTDITLVVTTFEDIGGVITGTFSGTVEEAGDTMTVENGQFNVIRVPNDALDALD